MTEYSVAFGFGWLPHRQSGLLNIWARRWPLNLALALGLTAACLSTEGGAPQLGIAQPGVRTAAYAAAYSVGMWSWTLAVIGLALRFLSNHSPVRRYIADSSYWLYLIHLPIVMALQAMVSKLDWPAEAKILFILGIAFPLMFASYQLVVRRTVIGAVLSGRRAPKPTNRVRVNLHPEPAE